MSTRWYGSLQNRLEENKMLTDTIKVGTGMTRYSWSDCYPYEVVAVKDQKHVTVRRMDHKADTTKSLGMGHQNWVLTSDPNAPTMDMVKRGNYWYHPRKWTDDDGKTHTSYDRMNVSFGVAKYYYDWEF